jgi:photosystem II stability/assembly factor-like uncharacterized protein
MKTSIPILRIGLITLLIFLSTLVQGQMSWQASGPSNNEYNEKFAIQSSISRIALVNDHPDIILIGTNWGEIYRSTNKGESWDNISLNLPNSRMIQVLEIHPLEHNKIFAASRSRLFYSNDTGLSWQILLELDNIDPRALHIDPLNNSILLTSAKGSFFSSDMGLNWLQTDTDAGFDLIATPGQYSTVYLLKSSQSNTNMNLVQSFDSGFSFTEDQLIWDTLPIQEFKHGKLTLSSEDPEKIFIYLSGNQSNEDNNNLGLWVYNTNSGTLTKHYNGAPYTNDHPNLLTINNGSNFTKGFNYVHILANPQNAQELLFGAINLFSSTNSGIDFQNQTVISEHAPDGYSMNVRDMASNGLVSYIATDGGLYKSTNFFNDGNYELITDNIQGAFCYDFSHAWHSRSFVSSGEYNGSFARRPSYPDSKTKYAGGIENTFTALNLYSEQVFFNQELNFVHIPNNINLNTTVNPNYFKINPNSNKLPVKNTSLRNHPRRYNIAFIGQDNKLMKSENGGHTFYTAFSFNTSLMVTEIEISRINPDLMFLVLQGKASNSNSKQLMKSTDGGSTWTAIDLPQNLTDKHLLIALDANEEESIYLTQKKPSNSERIFHSDNAGQSWDPINSASLPKHFIHDLIFLTGYENGLIVCTEKSIYRQEANSGWQLLNHGLPNQISTSKANFYYKEGILQISSYGKGLWSMDLEESQLKPKATISVDKILASANCLDLAIFKFFDYSMVQKDQYSIQWDFEDAYIVYEIDDYKKNIVFNTPGIKTVALSIIDSAGNIVDRDSITVTVNLKDIDTSVDIDFEASSLDLGLDTLYPHYEAGRVFIETGGFGGSDACFWLNNKNISSNKKRMIPLAVNLSNMENPHLEFDLAYAQFACVYDIFTVYSKSCEDPDFTTNTVYNTEDLKTTETEEMNFMPSPDQWKKFSIPLTNLQQAERAFIYLEQLTPDGNNLFIDNIKIIDY